MTSSHRPAHRPLVRTDAEGAQRTAPSWESLTERLIGEAQEAGRFDDLPGQGRPLRLSDDSYAGDLALAHHLLHNAGVLPPWIEADRQVRDAEAQMEALLRRAHRSGAGAGRRVRLEAELERIADAHDDAVARLDVLAPTPRQQRPRLDRAAWGVRLAAVLTPERGTT